MPFPVDTVQSEECKHVCTRVLKCACACVSMCVCEHTLYVHMALGLVVQEEGRTWGLCGPGLLGSLTGAEVPPTGHGSLTDVQPELIMRPSLA